MSVYLDASIVVATLVPEPHSAIADRFFLDSQASMFLSEFAAIEVASAISRLMRMGRIGEDQAAGRLAEFDSWRLANTENIDVDQTDLRLASAFVRRFDLGLRAPDALHVAVCRRAGFELATLDRRLARAAETLGVRTALIG